MVRLQAPSIAPLVRLEELIRNWVPNGLACFQDGYDTEEDEELEFENYVHLCKEMRRLVDAENVDPCGGDYINLSAQFSYLQERVTVENVAVPKDIPPDAVVDFIRWGFRWFEREYLTYCSTSS